MNVFAATGAFVLVSLSTASGHGYIMDPAAVWKLGYPNNGYISEVKNGLWGDVDYSVFGYGPEGQLKYFAKNFPESGGTMRDLIMENQKVWTEGVDPVCGDTLLDEAKRTTMPASGKISFSGFTHPGPCELWCDDNKLAFANDCATEYPDNKVPFDAAKCAGANRFTLYWIAVHGTPWQVYTNCVYLKGGSADSASDGAIAANVTTTTPKATTSAPIATITTPKATAAAPKATTATPASTTAPANATATSTPSPTKKCTAKVRRA